MEATKRSGWIVIGCLFGLLLVVCMAGGIGWLGLRYVSGRNIAPVVENNDSMTMVNRIVFVSTEGRIATIAPDGRDMRLLTASNDLFYLFPAWSPDGQKLAAIGGNHDGGGVYLLTDSPDQAPQPLYTSPDQSPFYLYWSPDGRQVSFLANHSSDGIGLHLALADGSRESLLATGQPVYWDWAANSQQLLLHAGRDNGPARLAFFDLTTETVGENISQPGFFQAPVISHDNRYLAFAEVDEAEQRWLVIRNQESGESQREPHLGAVALGWSPTTHWLAYISPAGDDPHLFEAPYGPLRLLEAETGQSQPVTDKMVLAFFWSPNGEYLAYLTLATGAEEINAFRPESTYSKRVHQEPVRLNLWLFTLADKSTRRLLTFVPSTLFATQFLPFFDQYALSHALWSPASDALVLPTVSDEANEIVVISVNGVIRPVAEGSVAFWSRN